MQKRTPGGGQLIKAHCPNHPKAGKRGKPSPPLVRARPDCTPYILPETREICRDHSPPDPGPRQHLQGEKPFLWPYKHCQHLAGGSPASSWLQLRRQHGARCPLSPLLARPDCSELPVPTSAFLHGHPKAYVYFQGLGLGGRVG